MDIEIADGSEWYHPSGVRVTVVSTGFIKNEDTFHSDGPAWKKAVMYRNYNGMEHHKIYSRTEESFLAKFTKVE